jgi:hypothetical protein
VATELVGNLKDAITCDELPTYPGSAAIEVIFHLSRNLLARHFQIVSSLLGFSQRESRRANRIAWKMGSWQRIRNTRYQIKIACWLIVPPKVLRRVPQLNFATLNSQFAFLFYPRILDFRPPHEQPQMVGACCPYIGRVLTATFGGWSGV